MSRCPNCGSDELFDGLDSDYVYCTDCDELVEPVDDDGADEIGTWCDTCDDYRPVGDDGCCARCGADLGG